MRSRNRFLVILICLFLTSFKVAAGSVFVDAAIERAQMHQNSIAGTSLEQSHAGKEVVGEQQSHSLFLMSHVTANISEIGIVVIDPPLISLKSINAKKLSFTQNFPDSAFKPPKGQA
ncbi:hypothetical protein [Polynucleobacter sp. MWH-Braz-FAM2G]|uniref:hypothetical protein n=1 Tax=Polynucleobacter sp. MWH-Braz-FAM2G TaxID=1855883 RepID=UPI001BFD1C6F|nr:hypothetical protein [Polynucleobacter sp. MWH-Braz-FAM2G]QWD91561.1 hypothetical protein FD973_04310 [Polynucleobacter sp. MWH-Braz-FAM2G]